MEKKGKKTLIDGQRKWKMDEEMLFVPKAVTAVLYGFSFNNPPSLLFTPIFSPALLCHRFSIFSSTFPSLSVFCSVSLFSSFLSLCELQQKADGAGLTSE